MTVSTILLTTGERVICDLNEVRENDSEDGRAVCLLMVRPYTLNLEKLSGEDADQEIQVRFSKWFPYSSDTQFRIPFTAVISIGAPDPGLAEAYRGTIEKAIKLEELQTTTTVTQNDKASEV